MIAVAAESILRGTKNSQKAESALWWPLSKGKLA
jgi:hypothetical protein